MNLQFARAELLVLLAIIPLWWLVVRPSRRSGVIFPRTSRAGSLPRGARRAAVLAALPRFLRVAALASLIVVLAGPILVLEGEAVEREEIAIVMAVDLSSSMLAEDMENQKNRMQVARETAVRFVRARADDRIGLVAFAGEALTRVPPTDDQEVVVSGVESLDIGLLEDGTDISGAILTSTSRLRDAPHTTKLIILLTDGAHNAHGVSPLAAAEAATTTGAKIYAISILGDPTGADTSEPASALAISQRAQLAAEIETVLTQVARVSGGRYFHAADGAALDSIYRQIDRMETTSVTLVEQTETAPVHAPFLFAALFLICAEVAVKGSRLGTVP